MGDVQVLDVADDQGRTVRLQMVDGTYLPMFPVKTETLQHLKNIKEMEIRDDDVFIVAFPKSGTHWLWEMVYMLKQREAKYCPDTREHMFVEFMEADDLKTRKSPRVFNTQVPFRFLPAGVKDKQTKMIYVVRNPKDVCVSLYTFLNCLNEITPYEGTFSGYLKLFMEGKNPYGSWFDHVQEYDQASKNTILPLHFMKYEDMIQDPVGETRRVSEFLGTGASDQLCGEIADACSFPRLKKAHDEVKLDPFAHVFKPGMASCMYRKGVVGDWQNWFTVAESEAFDHLYRNKMAASDISLRFTV